MPYNDEILAKVSPLDETSDLTMETKIARWLLQESISKGNFGLSVALLNSIPRIISTAQLNDLRQARMLPASSVIFIARETVRLVIEQMESHGISPDDISLISSELMSGVNDLFQVVKDRQLLSGPTPPRNQ